MPKHTGLEGYGGAALCRYFNVWSSVSLCSQKGLNKHTLLAARPSIICRNRRCFLNTEREGSLTHVLLYLRVILKPLWTWKHNQKRIKPAVSDFQWTFLVFVPHRLIYFDMESISRSYSPSSDTDPSTPACLFFCWHTHCLLQLAWLAVESSAARDVILQSWHASCRVFTALVSDMFERHISERVSVLVNIEARLFSRAGSCEHRVVKILSMHFKSAVSTRKALWWQRCVRLEHDPLCVVAVAWKYDLNQKKGHEKSDLYNQ